MKMMKVGIILALILSISVLSYAASNLSPASRDTSGSRPWVKHADIKGTSDKIDRGVRRLLFGWTEIPKAIVKTTNETGNPIWGITGGTAKGLAKAFPRTISGASDLIGVTIVNPDKPPVSPDPIDLGGTTKAGKVK